MRDVVIALQAQGSKCYHLGVGKHVSISNLAKANEQRDCRIFEEFAYYMIEQVKQNLPIIHQLQLTFMPLIVLQLIFV